MRKWLLSFTIITAIVLAACSKGANEEQVPNEEESFSPIEADSFGDVLLNEEYERIYAAMSEDFQDEVSEDAFIDLATTFNEDVKRYQLTSEVPLGEEGTQYVWIDDQEEKGFVVVIDPDGIILGLQMLPLEKEEEIEETETTFHFPFADEWFVLWGGNNNLVNYHYDHKEQRYAYDFLKVKDGASYDGDPLDNESYYAFGEDYLAPADGTVTKIENDVPDNEEVGEMNPNEPLGNYVILDHGNGEYSYLAHFQEGSIYVSEGDVIHAGDLLGKVGNSGNSSEPHIHFHVADDEELENATSIPIQFKMENPIQGDYVNNEQEE